MWYQIKSDWWPLQDFKVLRNDIENYLCVDDIMMLIFNTSKCWNTTHQKNLKFNISSTFWYSHNVYKMCHIDEKGTIQTRTHFKALTHILPSIYYRDPDDQ